MSISQGIFLKRQVIAIGLILAAGIVFAIGMVNPHIEHHEFYPTYQAAFPPAEEFVPSRAEQVARALVKAYPRRILRAEYRDGDWAVLMRDTWFYYAEGRLLPEEHRHRAAYYRPIAFYNNYPRDLPPWTPPSPDQISRFRDHAASRPALPPRAHYFFDALYRASSFEESYRRVKTIRFLGNPVTVHHAILEELTLVEDRILQAAQTDSRVMAWINDIDRMYGWNWRNVGNTQSRSFHSYGVAVDILPRNLRGRAVYWRWAGPNWWTIPHDRRHHPPEPVVQAFEAYGFVWGGKWAFFDTIHFEFRPEVFILNGLELSVVR